MERRKQQYNTKSVGFYGVNTFKTAIRDESIVRQRGFKMKCPECGYKLDEKFVGSHDEGFVMRHLCGLCRWFKDVLHYVHERSVVDEQETHEPSYDYAVMKEGSDRALRVFDELAVAELYMSKLRNKEDYYIEERERA